MKRRLEPELMDTDEQAAAYAAADFNESNSLFIDLLKQLSPGSVDGARALDLGCGPADIVIRFLRTYPKASCDAVDGSQPMLDLAQAELDRLPGIAQRCRLICDSIPSGQLPQAHYDFVLSNSLLHHLHDPQVLWRTVKETSTAGAIVLIMDLMRPASAGWAEALVETYTRNESEVLRTDFRNSLFAAFEPAEVTAQLAAAGLESALEVKVVSDRHLAVMGRLPG
ncbi:class I SAM-dependent methyltransferase [Thiorhodococcus mannitoliphagus]|uniref:Class I SAM-dependent methyltransferase n=1 Tax=Thiorhodococcus mannitoliphagus TaxID=329406 RepID=A0A6P1DR92_9GAMM|nr:class I SAM-dependent methyltransferase [Thiorhodococcus mannitoliphagus]NEX19451.1 class I SAM-dependent methyltransferase [Thiorhodococcus mannitoliphagus]